MLPSAPRQNSRAPRTRVATAVATALLAISFLAAPPAQPAQAAASAPATVRSPSPAPTAAQAEYAKALTARKNLDAAIAYAKKISAGSRAKYLTKAERAVVTKALPAATKARTKASKQLSKTNAAKSAAATKTMVSARATLQKKTATQRNAVTARINAQARFSAAVKSANKALSSFKKFRTSKIGKATDPDDMEAMEIWRRILVRERDEGYKKRSNTNATRTNKAAKQISATAKQLQDNVDSTIEMAKLAKRDPKGVSYWSGGWCQGADQIFYSPTKNWTRAKARANAISRKCNSFAEVYNDGTWRNFKVR